MKYKNSLHYCLCKRKQTNQQKPNIVRNRTWSSMLARRAFLTKMGAKWQHILQHAPGCPLPESCPWRHGFCLWNAPTDSAPSSSKRPEDRNGRRTSSHCGSWRAWGCGCYSFPLFSCPCLSRFPASAASLALPS